MSQSRVSFALRSGQSAASKRVHKINSRVFAPPLIGQVRPLSLLRCGAGAALFPRQSAAADFDAMPSLSARPTSCFRVGPVRFDSWWSFLVTPDQQPRSADAIDADNCAPDGAEGSNGNMRKMTTRESAFPLDESFIRDLEKASSAGDGEAAHKMVFDLYQSEMDRTKNSPQEKMGLHPHLKKLSFKLLLRAWENSSDPLAHEKAEWVLEKMWEGYRLGTLPLAKPKRFDYQVVMNCWAKYRIKLPSKEAKSLAGERTNRLLQDMRQRAMAGDASIRPQFAQYFHVLSAYAHAGDAGKCQRTIEMQKSDFRHGITRELPNKKSMQLLIQAWRISQRPEAPLKAQEIVDQMIVESESGNKDMTPDFDICKVVIYLWLESNRAKKEEAALDTLLSLRKRCLAGKVAGMPVVEIFAVVMNALAKHGDAKNVEILLRLALEDVENGTFDGLPGTPLFSALIKAWSRSKSPDAPEQAESVLREMWQRHDAGEWHCKPHRQAYTSLISCWANSRRQDCGERAERLLRDMQKRHNQGDSDLKPQVQHYGALCNAWASTRRNDAAAKVESVIAEMDGSGIAADSGTFNPWLKAVRIDHLPDKVKRAEHIISIMKQRQIQPNKVTNFQLDMITVPNARGSVA